MVGMLVCGLAGVFGVRTRTVTDGPASITYAQVTRRGLPTSWQLEIEQPDGFSGDLEVRTAADYWDAVEIQQIHPEPSSMTSEGDVVVWQFDKPEGTAFRVDVAGELDTEARPGRKPGSAAVVVGDQPIARLSYQTWVVP